MISQMLNVLRVVNKLYIALYISLICMIRLKSKFEFFGKQHCQGINLLKWINVLLTLDRIWKSSQRFGFSSRSLGHVMFWFAVTAQEAGAGGRSGATGVLVRGSLNGSYREPKHQVTKASTWEAETSNFEIRSKVSSNLVTSIWYIGSYNFFSKIHLSKNPK